MKRIPLTLFVVLVTAVAGAAQTQDNMKDCPMHREHQAGQATGHDHDLARRGDQGMGFAQDKTTHHFLLRSDGGAIQVTANSNADKTSIEHVRMHLRHIAQAFQSGDFSIAMFVHDQTPPGVPAITRLKDKLQYKYEELVDGGRVVITSNNTEAVDAVHQFLRFQITEHKTGDALGVK
jgi:hypothetical protein